MIWVLLFVAGLVKKAMDAQKNPVAIFSADRARLHGKAPNVMKTGTRLFGSKVQAGKLNTFSVANARETPSLGPQNPGGR